MDTRKRKVKRRGLRRLGRLRAAREAARTQFEFRETLREKRDRFYADFPAKLSAMPAAMGTRNGWRW
jgi:hypothetical protein